MRQAFDGLHRRRIHLFRHGDVSYVDDEGNRVADSRPVPPMVEAMYLQTWKQELLEQ